MDKFNNQQHRGLQYSPPLSFHSLFTLSYLSSFIMHLNKLLTALVATISFTQALVLPPTTTDIEARDSSPNTNLDSLLARAGAPVCDKTNSKQCTTCTKGFKLRKCDPKKQKCPTTSPSAKPTSKPVATSTGKPKTTKKTQAKPTAAPKPPCKPKKGKKCKREEPEHDDAELGELETSLEELNIDEDEDAKTLAARAQTQVAMYETRATPWAPGDSVWTHGLSVCSVIAVWDNNRVIMSHIPPGERQADGDILDSPSTLTLYLGRIDAEMQRTPLIRPKSGFFVFRSDMEAADKTLVRNWAIDNGITLQSRSYEVSPPPGVTFTLTRPVEANKQVTGKLQ